MPIPSPCSIFPVAQVRRRNVQTERRPQQGGVACFDTPAALEINRARLAHLQSLELPLHGKTVLDVGCGLGHLAHFFVEHRCRVVCVDGREENIVSLRQRYPGLEAHVADVQTDRLARLGQFDIVFCYGLLYHLEDPIAGLRNMASVCREMLLLETLVTDCSQPVLSLVDEPLSFNQALGAMGCRPSPSYVALVLNRVGFSFVYTPASPPAHEDFCFEWKNNLDYSREGHPIRCTFVASRTEMQNPRLGSLLTDS